MRRPTTAYSPGGSAEDVTRALDRDLPADRPHVLFRDATAGAGIHFRHFAGRRSTQLPEDMGSGAAWGDYDNDGRPDLFLANVAGPLTSTPAELARSPARNALYHNNGDGTFTDVTESAGLAERMIGMGAAWGDFDGDGFLDLAVSRYGGLHLYQNFLVHRIHLLAHRIHHPVLQIHCRDRRPAHQTLLCHHRHG